MFGQRFLKECARKSDINLLLSELLRPTIQQGMYVKNQEKHAVGNKGAEFND